MARPFRGLGGASVGGLRPFRPPSPHPSGLTLLMVFIFRVCWQVRLHFFSGQLAIPLPVGPETWWPFRTYTATNFLGCYW